MAAICEQEQIHPSTGPVDSPQCNFRRTEKMSGDAMDAALLISQCV